MRLWHVVDITESRFRAGEASEHRVQGFVYSHFILTLRVGRKHDSWIKTGNSNQTRGKKQSRNKRKFSSQMNAVDEAPDKTTWEGRRWGFGGGNQCLPLLNGDVNHLFQLEGFTGSEILCRNKLFSTWTHIYYTNYTITHIPLLEWANTHAF